jgi:hypothetical protein
MEWVGGHQKTELWQEASGPINLVAVIQETVRYISTRKRPRKWLLRTLTGSGSPKTACLPRLLWWHYPQQTPARSVPGHFGTMTYALISAQGYSRVDSLRAALQKIPSDVLWEVLDNAIIPILQDRSAEIMDDIVSVIEDKFDVYLSNPPPPDLNTRLMRREFSTLFEDLQRLSEDGAASRETDWEEWGTTLEQVADSFKYWLERIWLCVWEYESVQLLRCKECVDFPVQLLL